MFDKSLLKRAIDALDACTTDEGPESFELSASRKILAELRAAHAAPLVTADPAAQIMAEWDGGEEGRCIEPLAGWNALPTGTLLYAATPDAAPVAPSGRYIPPELVAAVRFYAQRQHFMLADSDAWDTVSGEPANFWEDEANTATVEDGSIARIALEGLESMPTQAAVDVLAERRRQVEREGWTPEHDDTHEFGDLAFAAACYATAGEGDAPPAVWPWDRESWKPRDCRRNMVKAAALLLAEIERLDRSEKGVSA